MNRQSGFRELIRLPVAPFVFLCMAVWLIWVLLATGAILKTPYLGAEFVRNGGEPGVRVEAVVPAGPAARAGLVDGDVVTALRDPETESEHILSDVAGVHDRSEVGSYADWARVEVERDAIWAFFATGTVDLVLGDGRTVRLAFPPGRGLATLPASYWVGLAHSFAVLLIGAGFAAFAWRTTLVGLLFLSSVSLSINILHHAFGIGEEFVYPPGLQAMIYFMGNLSAPVFAYALLAMLWHTPRPPNRLPFATLAVGFAVLAFVVQHFRWFAFPVHPFQFPYLLAIVLAVGLIAWKWIAFRGDPIARATLSWVVLSIFLAVVPWFFVFSLPVLFGGAPLVSPNLAGLILTVIFVGFAFGAIRFRLFGMRTIWLWTLVWVATGAGLVLIDIVLLTQFHWQQLQALPTAIVLASWAFFPIKNYIHHRMAARTSVSLKEASLNLFDRLNAVTVLAEIDGRLARFLMDLFQASEVDHRLSAETGHVTIGENGLALTFPAVTREGAFVLRGRNRGQRLFSGEDRAAVDSLIELARRIHDQKGRELSVRETDRRQIVRDLHDDVGAKILSMIYAAPEGSSLRSHAGQALKALKDSLMTIENEEELDVAANWTPFWEEQADRLRVAGFTVSLDTDFDGARVLDARDFVNMKRIVEEHVSNTVKYADKAKAVNGRTHIRENGDFLIEMTTGIAAGTGQLRATGRGLANIRARAEESGATVRIGPADEAGDRFVLSLFLPFTE